MCERRGIDGERLGDFQFREETNRLARERRVEKNRVGTGAASRSITRREIRIRRDDRFAERHLAVEKEIVDQRRDRNHRQHAAVFQRLDMQPPTLGEAVAQRSARSGDLRRARRTWLLPCSKPIPAILTRHIQLPNCDQETWPHCNPSGRELPENSFGERWIRTYRSMGPRPERNHTSTQD